MFTGIVEELGILAAIEYCPDSSARIVVRGPLVTSDAKLGDSIAVNGVCLTVTGLEEDAFEADVMKETLDRTTLAQAKPGSEVNLERAMRMDWRLGGHIVSGHVDLTGMVLSRNPATRWEVVRIGVDAPAAAQIAVRGSIAVDGVSLTVTDVGQDGDRAHWFEVSLIPATLSNTTLGQRQIGDPVNVETDVLAKYVQRLMIGPNK